jgi:hypothetical protein
MPNDKIVDEQLNEIMDVSIEIAEETKKVPTVISKDRSENIENDYEYARENLYNLVERGQDALDGIIQLSKETEHPRAYEVAGQLIKTVSDTAEKLIDLQKKLKELEKEDEKSSVKTQHNHLYVGSTAELQKFLKKNKE